jgi:hypothetical protein
MTFALALQKMIFEQALRRDDVAAGTLNGIAPDGSVWNVAFDLGQDRHFFSSSSGPAVPFGCVDVENEEPIVCAAVSGTAEPQQPVVNTERVTPEPVVNTEPQQPVVNTEPQQPVVNTEPVEQITERVTPEPVVNTEPQQPVVNTEPVDQVPEPVVNTEPVDQVPDERVVAPVDVAEDVDSELQDPVPLTLEFLDAFKQRSLLADPTSRVIPDEDGVKRYKGSSKASAVANLRTLVKKTYIFTDMEKLKTLLNGSDYAYVNKFYGAINTLLRNLDPEEHRTFIGNRHDALMEVLKTAKTHIGVLGDSNSKRTRPTSETILEHDVPLEDCIDRTEEFTQSCLSSADTVPIKDLRACLQCRLNLIDNPPRRLEFCTLKFRDFDRNTDNFYEDGQVTYNVFKTAERYGPFTFAVSEATRHLIEIIVGRIEQESSYLFFDIAGSEQHEVLRTRWDHYNTAFYERVLGAPFTETDIRKLYVSTVTGAGGDVHTISDREELALKMGHSVKTQQEVYTVTLPSPTKRRRSMLHKAASDFLESDVQMHSECFAQLRDYIRSQAKFAEIQKEDEKTLRKKMFPKRHLQPFAQFFRRIPVANVDVNTLAT